VDTQNVYDWLFVIYVHEIPYYLHQSNAILRTILEAPAGGNVAVFVAREAVGQKMEPLAGGGVSLVNYYTLTLSELQFDERGAGNFVALESDVLCEGGEGWRQALRAIFPRVRARRRMLVSFSHGAAFGINVDMEGLMRSSGQCADLPILWMDDLAGELKNCLGDEAIDVLLLNNCYMQCMETGYVLREQVRFIVAAEGALEAIGYDYARLMRRLSEQTQRDAEEMAKGIIDDYAQLGDVSRDGLAGQAVFANRAGAYGEALTLLGRFLDILLDNMDEVADVLDDIRENKLLYVSAPLNAYTSNYLGMIDLFTWVGLVLSRLGHLFTATGLAAEFAVLRLRLVVAGKVGEGLVQHDAVQPGVDGQVGVAGTTGVDGQVEATGMPIFGYSGVSVFYPRSVDRASLQAIPRCAYERMTGPWKRFLEAYYQRSPQYPAATKNPDPLQSPGMVS
jgi:hypothetical protein